ncbi:GntR family transcriptional regulator [Paracidobacterium acidisoli]|uniref:GntR family transcriptional regulator n=1 Tax=Paracidobacterium acidisoli TaxID=2303751 RepID=A0A372ISF1_9BACT|nr:GntR family transcriptional regulator [Paracidobacterium acidisoli]MBT9330832.1 GntR family transcriptional regulator [Paracidobacterium acidisoli]
MPHTKNSLHEEASPLVKQSLAAKLREEIIQGHLAPGQRIIEGYWARRFGVAQTSVREAINLLIGEGFVTKASGRSARVTSYTESDLAEIYELRGALEGFAAHLAAQRRADLTPLEEVLKEMRRATKQGDVRSLIEADLAFHLTLCELSGNHFLSAQIRTLLVPLFAFVSMRVAQVHQTAKAWESDLDRHKRMIELIREGDPAAAEFTVRATLRHFAARAHGIWQEAR